MTFAPWSFPSRFVSWGRAPQATARLRARAEMPRRLAHTDGFSSWSGSRRRSSVVLFSGVLFFVGVAAISMGQGSGVPEAESALLVTDGSSSTGGTDAPGPGTVTETRNTLAPAGRVGRRRWSTSIWMWSGDEPFVLGPTSPVTGGRDIGAEVSEEVAASHDRQSRTYLQPMVVASSRSGVPPLPGTTTGTPALAVHAQRPALPARLPSTGRLPQRKAVGIRLERPATSAFSDDVGHTYE